MKQITAIFRPQRLEAVETALRALPRLPGFTLYQARGHARGHGPAHHFVADEWNPDAHDAIVLLIMSSDEDAPGIVAAVSEAARTGHPGDGIVGVVELSEALRIRSGERDAAAL